MMNAEDELDADTSANEKPVRENWSRKLDFMLSCLSYAVGLGNVWRFPYVCYRNGAGAFLFPFVMMLFITGIPLVFLELSFGQYASLGVVSVWKASPIFQGIGWAMFLTSTYICIYYNMIIAYTLYFLFASFTSVLPWKTCGDWSTDACSAKSTHEIPKCFDAGGNWCNSTCYKNWTYVAESVKQGLRMTCLNTSENSIHRTPSDEYFHNSVLGISDNIETLGHVRWELVGCLALAWVLVAVCLAKGIKSSGKAVYFTAFFPYIVLTILFVKALTLDGAIDGLMYFLTPQWDKLLEPKVWGDAAVQIFFSLSPGWGGLITLASYNKFNNNCMKDAILVSILDTATSIFAGLVIFSIIGFMAKEIDRPVKSVVSEGAGLAFVAYPEVVTKLPISQLWSVLFFAMLITLGIGTQIATVTTVQTTLVDRFPSVFRKNKLRKILLLVGISLAFFLLGLPFCTQGGMYILQLFDNYAATYSLLIVGIMECIAISWVYGGDRFLTDIGLMIGRKPHWFWKYSWQFVSPSALLLITVLTLIYFEPTKYNSYVFPSSMESFGFFIAFSSVSLIPIVAIIKIVLATQGARRDRSFKRTLIRLCKPTEDWGPALHQHRQSRKELEYGQDNPFMSREPLTKNSTLNDTIV